ncbi:lytic transglycosylase domain-containing protein [Bacillus niameyensis]|uniref:lytic transglycosylase domain-containing protein n=1 Tax=Bacillus niameyensis TaxID=1522308 RepID=UPI000ABAB367|nr:lytic transglycosylase domain-containing protein [Bacillus niameyensis]
MNSLGQIKTLLDIQMLRGFSANKTSLSNQESMVDFGDLLQQALNTAVSSPSQPLSLNSLGTVHNLNLQQLNFQGVKSTTNVESAITVDNSKIDNLEAIIQSAAEKFQLPAKLIKSIIKHESNFNSSAVSQAGASGLMQLMPGTARGLGVQDIFDPMQNVMGGSKYLRQMLDKYDGNVSLALAAYNAGPGNVDKYGGIPPFKETQNYVNKVTSTFYS